MKNCFLIARTRSGTTVFRHFLGTNPEVFAYGEIFNEEYDQNYHNFLENLARDDPKKVSPKFATDNFLAYLDETHVRAQREKPSTRVVVYDVKIEQSHHLVVPWRNMFEMPYVFELAKRENFFVIHIARRNHLRRTLSNALMHLRNATYQGLRGKYHVSVDDLMSHGYVEKVPQKITIGSGHDLRAELVRIYMEQDRLLDSVRRYFEHYDGYLEFDYSELFFTGGGASHVSERVAREVGTLLGLSGPFDPKPQFMKATSQRLDEIIENYADVRRALEGTQYAWFLDDTKLS
jgi:hypothetical protein